MFTRRSLLKRGGVAALTTVSPTIWLRAARAQTPTSFDYYISPNGDDTNAGTLTKPWSITALNSRQSTYAGKRIGIIGDQGVIQYGRVGGVATSLYSLLQAGTISNGTPIQINGGPTSTQPTYLASCTSAGAYSARIAIIDGSNPSGGALPTSQTYFIGQSQYGNNSPPAQYGNVTIDGLTIRNFTFSALVFYGASAIAGVNILNCELYNGQNVQSNNNPGAIWLFLVNSAVITNCSIHDLQTDSSGSYHPWQHCGVITFQSYGTNITNCTFFNCIAVSQKDGLQNMNVSYCYLGYGTFGNGYGAKTGLGSTVQNYVTASGMVNLFHHNIVLGPIMGWGESGQENQGLIQVYNNTFYQPSYGGTNLLCALDATKGNGGGMWKFYNNIVYSTIGYENGNWYAGAFALGNANTNPAQLPLCDYNVYGSGMTFATGWGSGQLALSLSTWQGYGFDTHSKTLSSRPFTVTPSEGLSGSFAIVGPASTAGVGGVACGAMDNSGTVGCIFGVVPNPPQHLSVT